MPKPKNVFWVVFMFKDENYEDFSFIIVWPDERQEILYYGVDDIAKFNKQNRSPMGREDGSKWDLYDEISSGKCSQHS